MKRIVGVLLALAVLAALVIVTTISKHSVRAVYAQSGCSLATLNGNYAFSQSSFAPKKLNGNQLPGADVGVFTFDGAGNFSVAYADAFAGVISRNQTGSGTYTVNSDCTGSVSCGTGDCAGVTANTVIIGDGTEFFGINTTPSVTATFVGKKQ